MNEMTQTTGTRTITAMYDTRVDAEKAIARLVTAGVPRSSIDLKAGAATGATSTTTSSHDNDGGFWESLKDLFVPDDDRATYAEGLRRGGHMVVARVDSAHYETALDILDDEGTMNIDERAETWRSEGWSGYVGDKGTPVSGMAAGTATGAVSGSAALGGAGRSTAATDKLATGGDEVISVMEEQLRVGKREVDHGRVKVRSYVVETPVEEQVSLRQEHVTIERRPVDRAVTGNETLFKDRTIEVEERTEEAVISKEARVKEEIAIGKTSEERKQTVSDTVRRTEVEIEDERGTVTGTGTTTPRRAG